MLSEQIRCLDSRPLVLISLLVYLHILHDFLVIGVLPSDMYGSSEALWWLFSLEISLD